MIGHVCFCMCVCVFMCLFVNMCWGLIRRILKMAGLNGAPVAYWESDGHMIDAITLAIVGGHVAHAW